MLNSTNHEALADAFRTAVEREFRFLVDEDAFQMEIVKPCWIQYRSKRTYVNIYHESNFGLQVEFNLTQRVSIAEDPPYGLSDLFYAISGQVALPSDIEDLVRAAKEKPGRYSRWFFAETVPHVNQVVRRLAELTKEYGRGLLGGDIDAYSMMNRSRSKRTDAWHRSMWLGELPPEVAVEAENLPIGELEHVRNEHLKDQIISTYGDAVAEIRDLPADEFLKRYVSLRLKRQSV